MVWKVTSQLPAAASIQQWQIGTMSADKLWQDIMKVALVGSERQSLSLSVDSPDPLAAFLAGVVADPPEEHLLQVAGTVALYRRAGFRPTQLDLAAPAPCDGDDLPPCGPLARRLLGTLLAGERKELFPEWLARATAAAQRVPAELLPKLLDRGKQDVKLRPHLLPVLGKRGQWLAGHNPDWEYAAAAANAKELDLDVWQTGRKEARLALLRELRGQDPEKARELVARTWTSEKADARVAQLEILTDNLTPADEPWLETVLDDRSKQVRQRCAALLAELPESRLCQRMAARALPLLTLGNGGKGKTRTPKIDVNLPAACDSAMERDGIIAKPPDRSGEKVWWLEQILGRVSPQLWCQQWQLAPQLILQGIEASWQGPLLRGLAAAAISHKDSTWAEALLHPESFDLAPDYYFYDVLPFPNLCGLFEILPPDKQRAFILKLLKTYKKNPSGSSLLFKLLGDVRSQPFWSTELIETFLQEMRSLLVELSKGAADDKTEYQFAIGVENFFGELLASIPMLSIELVKDLADVIDEFQTTASAEKLGRFNYLINSQVRPCIDCLRFRHQIHQAFS